MQPCSAYGIATKRAAHASPVSQPSAVTRQMVMGWMIASHMTTDRPIECDASAASDRWKNGTIPRKAKPRSGSESEVMSHSSVGPTVASGTRSARPARHHTARKTCGWSSSCGRSPGDVRKPGRSLWYEK